MLHRVLLKSRIIILLCYCVYALSPVYAVLPASISAIGHERTSQHEIELGILFLNILLDSITDDEDPIGVTAHDSQLRPALQDKDIILIQKKRAVNKRYYLAQPSLKASTVATREIKAAIPVACTYEVPRDLIRRHADGCYSLSTGLSPPSFIS